MEHFEQQTFDSLIALVNCIKVDGNYSDKLILFYFNGYVRAFNQLKTPISFCRVNYVLREFLYAYRITFF